MTGMSKPPVKTVSDDEVRALLDRYRCPVPFHAVRTRFLGNIASPVVSASPLDALKGLWGGELPVFDSLDAVNELLAALIMGCGIGFPGIRNGARRFDCCVLTFRERGKASRASR